MFKTALTYGSISGVIIISVIVLGIIVSGGAHGDGGGGIFSSVWFGYLVMLIALSMVFLAVRDYRNKTLGGVIKFLPAFLLGLMIAMVAAVAYMIAWEFYLAATKYAFVDTYVAHAIEAERASGATGAALEAKIAELNTMKAQYANPLFRLPMTFLEIFPVGLLIALISAAVLRNPKVLPARA
jgi:hypothetical protein